MTEAILEQVQFDGLHLRRRLAEHAGPGPDIVPDIVYVHGLGESGLCFERLMTEPRLATLNHFAPDLPGYGKSPWPRDPLSLSNHANVCAAFIRKVTNRPVVLLGHSMGGVIGTQICAEIPERIRLFINVEGNITLPDCAFSSRAVKHADPATGERTARAFARGGFDAIREAIYAEGQRAQSLRGYYASLRMACPAAFYLNSHELVAVSTQDQQAAALAALPVPVRYVLGEPDGTGAGSQARLTAAKVRWDALGPAGHWVFLDQHEAFVELVLGMLQDV